jgi:hypothetical protein
MSRSVWTLGITGILVFASGVFAQNYTMDLTSVGDGANADGVYVSPYTGTITGNGVNWSGYVICDDFSTESFLNTPWTATATNAASVNSSLKFANVSYQGHSAQDDYNAVAWLANGLLQASNVNSWTAQTNYSFAIWDIFDGASTDPSGGAAALITSAFNAVKGGYVGSNVAVFTPNPLSASQEFLVVNPPIATPEPSSVALLVIDLAVALGLIFFLRRRSVQA